MVTKTVSGSSTKTAQEAEGHVQQAPLLVVLIVEAGLGDGGHEDGSTVWGGGQPGSPIIMPQPLCSSDGGRRSSCTRGGYLLAGSFFRRYVQQGHGLWAPGRGHVLLHAAQGGRRSIGGRGGRPAVTTFLVRGAGTGSGLVAPGRSRRRHHPASWIGRNPKTWAHSRPRSGAACPGRPMPGRPCGTSC